MDKFAQRRGLLNKIHETGNLWGRSLEKFINPEFESIMNQLRDQTDDPVRAILSGETVGDADPGSFAFQNPGIKTIMDHANINFNEIEYVKCIIELDKFNTVMGKAIPILMEFDKNINEAHKEFLWKGIEEESDPETLEYLEHMKSRTAIAVNTKMIKNATWGSTLHSFLSGILGRAKSLKDWQKRFPGKTKELKIALKAILEQAKVLLKLTLTRLKAMATARAKRNLTEYLYNADVIVKQYQIFSSNFSKFYNTHFKGFIDERNIPKIQAPVSQPKSSVMPAGGGSDMPIELDLSNQPPRKSLAPAGTISDERPTDPEATNEIAKEEVKLVPDLDLPKPKAPITSITPIMPAPIVKKREVEKRVVAPKTKAPPALVEAPALVPAVQEEPKKPGPPEGLPGFGNMSSKHFIESLETLSNENPVVLANHIAKYATRIQKTNPKLAYQLTIIVDNIVG